MYGEPLTVSPEKYPLIQATEWALAQTDNADVKAALNQHIESLTSGVNASVKEGVEMVFVISHDIEIKREKDQLLIIKDTFTDKAKDNPKGFDNVTWSKGNFVREKPDWDLMIDYAMYNTPVETIGRILLDDFQPASDKAVPDEKSTRGYWFYYSVQSAVTYANNWSSNPGSQYYQECGYSLRRNTSKWNPSYSYVWNANSTIRCNDCADFVSQALVAGGFSTDSTWYPSYWDTWAVVDDLNSYLYDNYWGTWYVSRYSLKAGDLAFVYPTHVVIVTNVNPHRYSGHTNDRKNYSMGYSFNLYMHLESSLYKY